MRLNKDVKYGTTRTVVLLGKYAFKFPRIHHNTDMWKLFLQGLLANMQETLFGTCGFKSLCPVVFHIPGGFLTVMLRAEPLSEYEWTFLDLEKHFENEVSPDLVEFKQDSFGKLNGNIVAVDYG